VIDEPMVGLDPRSAWILKDLLRAYVREGGTALVSTHTLELAESLCDRLAVMDRGRLAAQGTLADLRRAAAREEGGLEEIFLRITRADAGRTLGRVLGG
jgi:ABC-2 type transport system ATP-binding protein